MKEIILAIFRFNLSFSHRLAADVPEDQMCAQPVPGKVMNHGAFLLGHLAWADDNAIRVLGGTPALSEQQTEIFRMGAKPLPDRALYPSKAELLSRLEGAHERLAEAFASASPEVLAQPAPERMRSRFKTNGHLVVGLMTAHEASHNGQFSAWRRAMGWPSVS
jgi:uncharacterized damage-inducible protein DinB